MICRFKAYFKSYFVYLIIGLQKQRFGGFYPAPVQVMNGRAAVKSGEILRDFLFVNMEPAFKHIKRV